MNKKCLNFLCCPECRCPVVQVGRKLRCQTCGSILQITDNIILNKSKFPPDLQISAVKWDKLYRDELTKRQYKAKYSYYMETFFSDVYWQLNKEKAISKIIYLEIGCGDFLLGQAIAKKCKLVIGVDISEAALKIAKRMFEEKGITNYLLVQGDINRLPIKDECVDLIYGGGVIEHFKDTTSSLRELNRVLKRNGVSFNTVPYLNIGSLTYRQLWGNIPNFPVLKQIAEYIHINLLGAKHMIFGYEMSFTKKSLIKFHKEAGFRRVKVDQFKINLSFDFIPKKIRPIFINLANKSPLFWPMVKVVGIK